jgi:hypothetical protein
LPLDACIWFWKTIPRWDLLYSEFVTLYVLQKCHNFHI